MQRNKEWFIAIAARQPVASERGRDVDAEQLGRLQVDDELELGRPHYRHIGGLLTLKSTIRPSGHRRPAFDPSPLDPMPPYRARDFTCAYGLPCKPVSQPGCAVPRMALICTTYSPVAARRNNPFPRVTNNTAVRDNGFLASVPGPKSVRIGARCARRCIDCGCANCSVSIWRGADYSDSRSSG